MALPSSPSCVITGAGSGFGRALSLELASRGARLLISDINMAGLEETAQLATAKGGTVKTLRCDVTKLAEVEALAAAVEGPVDLMVNNAGVAAGGLVGDLGMEDWRWVIEIDLFGVIYGCHVFTPIFKKQGKGHLLNVASAAGLIHAPRMGPYNVSKAGVVALSETLSAELSGTGVGVTVLCPTFFQTRICANGRFADAKTKAGADKMMAKAIPAEGVVKAALAAVERGSLYCVPMADGRFLWRFKRLNPAFFIGAMPKVMKLMGLD